MLRQYGYGDYERSDVETLTSTWDLRCDFLKALFQHRPAVFSEIFEIVDWNAVPDSYKQGDTLDLTFFLYFSSVFRGDPYGMRLPPERFEHSIVYLYYQLVLRRAAEISSSLGQIGRRGHPFSEVDDRTEAISNVFPSWRAVKRRKGSAKFRQALSTWGTRNGIAVDWIFDLVIYALNRLWAESPNWGESLDINEVTDPLARASRWQYEEKIRRSVSDGISHIWWRRVNAVLFKDAHYVAETFRFVVGDFQWDHNAWIPTALSRRKYTSEATSRFRNFLAALESIRPYDTFNEADLRDRAASYFDDVQERLVDRGKFVPTFDYNCTPELCLISKRYIPQQTKEDFVEAAVGDARLVFTELKQTGSRLPKLKKDDIELQLHAYCARVEKSIPANFQRVPSRTSAQTHLIWLIRYQIPPTEMSSQIAKSDELGQSPAGVMKAIKRIANTLALPLRPPCKPGRPVGSRDGVKRRRETRRTQ